MPVPRYCHKVQLLTLQFINGSVLATILLMTPFPSRTIDEEIEMLEYKSEPYQYGAPQKPRSLNYCFIQKPCHGSSEHFGMP